jgi:hypothetical protein
MRRGVAMVVRAPQGGDDPAPLVEAFRIVRRTPTSFRPWCELVLTAVWRRTSGAPGRVAGDPHGRRHRTARRSRGRHALPSGHDAWVVGDEDVVVIDWFGASNYESSAAFVARDGVVQRWRYSWNGGHVRGVDPFRVADGLIAEKLSYVKG